MSNPLFQLQKLLSNPQLRQLANHPQIRSLSSTKKGILGLSAAYLAVVNAGAFALFFYDKQCALHGQWRIPEKTLCLSAALNGWIGGMIAMEMFRHKTKKQSFRDQYFMSVGVGMLWGGLAAAMMFWAPLRRKVLGEGEQIMKQVATRTGSATSQNAKMLQNEPVHQQQRNSHNVQQKGGKRFQNSHQQPQNNKNRRNNRNSQQNNNKRDRL